MHERLFRGHPAADAQLPKPCAATMLKMHLQSDVQFPPSSQQPSVAQGEVQRVAQHQQQPHAGDEQEA